MLRKSTAALLFGGFVSVANAWAQEHAMLPAPTVSVIGQVEENVRPDIAIVTLNVIDDRPSANDAANENARLTAAVIDGLKGSGVDAKDIMTVGVSLVPLMTEQRDPRTNQIVKSVPSGFHASNTLTVRVREIDRAGAFIAASVQNGALYQGVYFELSDRAAREDALRVKAVENAIHRASLYAEGAKLKLGSLRSLSEGESRGAPAPMTFSRAMNAAPGVTPLPIEPGQITLSQSVSASWELTAP